MVTEPACGFLRIRIQRLQSFPPVADLTWIHPRITHALYHSRRESKKPPPSPASSHCCRFIQPPPPAVVWCALNRPHLTSQRLPPSPPSPIGALAGPCGGTSDKLRHGKREKGKREKRKGKMGKGVDVPGRLLVTPSGYRGFWSLRGEYECLRLPRGWRVVEERGGEELWSCGVGAGLL